MGLLGSLFNWAEDYHPEEYDSAEAFADKYQYEFAASLGIDEDEGYYEAKAYWQKNHK